ncbi:MAG: AAA family ATPase, partial [Acetobacteraceae bacterium]
MMLPLHVTPARPEDTGRGVARLDPADMARLGLAAGDLVALTGNRRCHARALPQRGADRAPGRIALDGATRGNAGVALDEVVRAGPGGSPARAASLRLAVTGGAGPSPAALARSLAGVPLAEGDSHALPLLGGREAGIRIVALDPPGPALLDEATRITLAEGNAGPSKGLRYEDLGGLSRVLDRVREVVELPLRHRAAFEALGIAPPKG